jgi:hypothetical protein
MPRRDAGDVMVAMVMAVAVGVSLAAVLLTTR